MRTEQQLDSAIRDALVAAALADFSPALSGEPKTDWSPSYIRSRRQLLVDPKRWYRNKKRPVWRRTLERAACILLVLAVSLGALWAASPTVRAFVSNWIRSFNGSVIHYESVAPVPERRSTAKTAAQPKDTAAVIEDIVEIPDAMEMDANPDKTEEQPENFKKFLKF
jgi:hypothetical protein